MVIRGLEHRDRPENSPAPPCMKLPPNWHPTRRDIWAIAIASLLLYGQKSADAQIYITTRNFYIAATGNDSNLGTQASPWLTIGRVNSNKMLYGDIYHFNGGDTFSDAAITPTNNGIRVTSYGTGMATISRSADYCYIVSNFSNLSVDSLIITGTGGTTQAGISFTCPGTNAISNINVTNCVVSGFAGNGIEILATTGGVVTGVNILNCTVHDCTLVKTGAAGTAGIYLFGTYGSQTSGLYNFINPLISNCIAYNCTGATGSTNWVGSGIFMTSSINGLIVNCTAHDNGANNNFGAAGPVGIFIFDSKNSKISVGESYLNKTLTFDGDGFDCDGGVIGCTIEFCYAHQNFGFGLLAFCYNDGMVTANTGTTIRFCIAEKNATDAKIQQGDIGVFNQTGVTTGVAVYNNTVYGSTTRAQSGCICIVNDSGGIVANNIFYAASGVRTVAQSGTTNTGLAFHTNDYFSPGGFTILWNGTVYTSLATWQSGASQDATGLNVDPMLTNPGNGGTIGFGNPLSGLTEYLLLPGSPMIRAGINLTTALSINPGPVDFYSNAINPATLSIGADCP